MDNFQLFNPVNVIFGKNTIGELPNLLKDKSNILFAFGGGSIKKNGVYQQIRSALANKNIIEFSGIEANPDYDTLIKAVELCKNESVDFILAVGGGSVIDGCKFIAHAAKFKGKNAWDILCGKEVKDALPLGCVLTLSATGSEMNTFSVISKRSTKEKRAFSSTLSFPKFSILDPTFSLSLPERQIINGIIDPYVHVTEQYLTYNVNAPLQTRQSEAILLTLIEEGPKALKNLENYEMRANLMWCATNALNGTIGKGVPQDWATHEIGHELTAQFGLDHAQTLAVILPAVLKHEFENKKKRLAHYGTKVFAIKGDSDSKIAKQAIEKTEKFFRSLGAKTRLSEYKITKKSLKAIPEQVMKVTGGKKLGEHGNIGAKEIGKILDLAFEK
ncbi:iron-containing alcohol dehydrogenase [Fluviispira sanaruensis]|uniref:NADH-dependent alcohol dehydrogenase n=1 Tax=Fluviispira sanaruensis TaxID=2493639 RepID=A0A4P2VXW4_FLUSA|nr:iron-containing alcohol dehydrogenase [Fluviispira sanaruensis]BBH54505.1 NADH-dependent alcohol dehydrogenase [Fluviispira sanaruensis]